MQLPGLGPLQVSSNGAEMSSWQLISTAPVDGTKIMVIDPKGNHIIARFCPPGLHGGSFYSDEDRWVIDPTHWQPLDDPPPKPNPITELGINGGPRLYKENQSMYWHTGGYWLINSWVKLAHKILEAESKGWVE